MNKKTSNNISLDKETYKMLFEKASIGIILLQDEKIKLVNPKILEFTKYSIDEIINSSFIEYIYPEDRDITIKHHISRLTGDENGLEYDIRILDRNGDMRWIGINGTMVMWEGRPATLNYITDKTDQKNFEAELFFGKETTQALLNATKDFAMLMEIDGTILAINEIAAQRQGSSVKELIGMSFFEISPEYLVKYREEIGNKVVRYKKPISYEEVHIERIYDNNLYPIMDENGEVKKLAVYSHDITEYKKALEAVKESEEKFRSLIENSSDGILVLDEKGFIKYASNSVESVLGYDPYDVIEKTVFDYIYRDDIEAVLYSFNKLLNDPNYSESIQVRVLHKDSSCRYIEGIGKNLLSNPVIGGIILNFKDITDRKKAEDYLNIYKQIVSSSSDQMAFIDKNYIFLATNDAFLRSFNLGRKMVEGHRVEDIFGKKEFKEYFYDYFRQCFSGVSLSFERWFEYSGIGKKYVVFSFNPFTDINNEVMGVVVNIRDITERVQMEMDMVDMQEKEQQRIGIELHDGLSHYLLGIAIKSRLLAQKLKSNSIDESKEAYEIESLINQAIKETKNLASGLFQADIDDVNLQEILHNIKKDVELRYNINCILNIDHEISIEDKKVIIQIYYIIQEAIRNSIKYSKTEKIMIKLEKENKNITLIIKDYGIGIPDDYEIRKGMGFNIMKYRSRIFGGSLRVIRAKGGGTEVVCSFKI